VAHGAVIINEVHYDDTGPSGADDFEFVELYNTGPGDKRESSPPELAAEETRIRNEMLREFVTERIAELRAAADVEIVEPETPADGEAGASDGGGAPSDGGEAAPANGGSSQ
jgi:hypothetical protein